jgi:hypothetical protein
VEEEKDVSELGRLVVHALHLGIERNCCSRSFKMPRGRPRKDSSTPNATSLQDVGKVVSKRTAPKRIRKRMTRFEEEVWVKSTSANSGKKNSAATLMRAAARNSKKIIKVTGKKRRRERASSSPVTAIADDTEPNLLKICAACFYGRHTAHIEGCERRKDSTSSPGRSYRATTSALKSGKNKKSVVLIKTKKDKKTKLPIVHSIPVKARIKEICKACAFGRHTAHIPGCDRRRSSDNSTSTPRKNNKGKKDKKKKKKITSPTSGQWAPGIEGYDPTLIHEDGECLLCVPGSGKPAGHIGRHMLTVGGSTYMPVAMRKELELSKPSVSSKLLTMLAGTGGKSFLGSPRAKHSGASKKVGVGFVNSSDRETRRKQGMELWNDVVEPYFISTENASVLSIDSFPSTYREIRRMLDAENEAKESLELSIKANLELEKMASSGDSLAAGALRDIHSERKNKRPKKSKGKIKDKVTPIDTALRLKDISLEKQKIASNISQNPSFNLPEDVHLGKVPLLDEHYLKKWEEEDRLLHNTPQHVHSREARKKLREEERWKRMSKQERQQSTSKTQLFNNNSNKRNVNKRGRSRSSTSDKNSQKDLEIGELVEVTERVGKGRSWEGGTAKLLAIHEKDGTMDVKYIIGGKGTKIPKIFIRRFGTAPVEISQEDMDKSGGIKMESNINDELLTEYSHGVVIRTTGTMSIINQFTTAANTTATTASSLPTKVKRTRRSAAIATEKANIFAKLKTNESKEDVKFVVRCWTGTSDPDPRPNIYFGNQRISTIPLKDIDESEKALKQQQQENNDSVGQKPATAHSWRHADRPPSSSSVDVQVRVDNTLSKMYLPLDLNIDQTLNGTPPIDLEIKTSSVIDKDTEDNELCDEVCAELQYLQWKLENTIAMNFTKTKPLIQKYETMHQVEMTKIEKEQLRREAIDELSEQVIAAQKAKEEERLKEEQKERLRIMKVSFLFFLCLFLI